MSKHAPSTTRGRRECCEISSNVRSLSLSGLVTVSHRESLPLSSHTTRRYARVHQRDIRHRVRVPSRGRRRRCVEAPRSVGAPPKMPRRTHRGKDAPPTNSPPSVAAMHAPVCIPDCGTESSPHPTQAYRVMHGVAEGKPGVTVDKYGSTLFVQSWRSPVVRTCTLPSPMNPPIKYNKCRHQTIT